MTMNKVILLAVASTLAALVACDNDPAKNKTRAQVSDPTPAAQAATVTNAAAVKYNFSQASSKVEWTGAKVTAKHDGSFDAFTGTVSLVDGSADKSSVTVDIDTVSLKVEPERLAGHLKSGDFFDVQKYPKATFVSTQVKAGGANGATHTVTGNLTLHGVTKSITFPAIIAVAGDDVKVNAEFAINRKDFGIMYPGKPDDLIKDEVLIKLTIDAKKGAQG
jgi:polyisoprenoid-binding protein YceI